MAHLSLYRKYRSQTFSDLIGQDHVVRTLQNALKSGRMAHAYLFTGPRGTGKTSTARLLAKALCCAKGPTNEPCNECEQCISITNGSCMDVLEMDAASESGVDDVRETIVETVEYKPTTCRFKVFIIDEVHDLSAKAFDALLKTIEEPPDHIVFILATTEYNKVPPTVRSRCQKYEFHRANLSDLVKRLEHVARHENAEVEQAALTAMARMADGGYRDALNLLEQAIITSDGPITIQHVYDQLGLIDEQLVDNLLCDMRESNFPRIIDSLQQIAQHGRDPRSVLESLLYRLADLTRVAYGVEVGASVDATHEASLHETVARLGPENLLKLRARISDAHKTIRDISLPKLWLESELLRVAADFQKPKQEAKPVQTEAPAATQPAAPKPEPAQPKVEEPKPKKAPEPTAEKPKPAPEKPVEPSKEQAKAPKQEENTNSPVELQMPEKTGDLELDRARDAWAYIVFELSKISETMRLKLTDVTVKSYEDDVVTLEFGRQLDCDWIVEGRKRQGAILEGFRKKLDEKVQVKCVVRPKNAEVNEDPPAVEMVAEGDKLVQMAKEIFSS